MSDTTPQRTLEFPSTPVSRMPFGHVEAWHDLRDELETRDPKHRYHGEWRALMAMHPTQGNGGIVAPTPGNPRGR